MKKEDNNTFNRKPIKVHLETFGEFELKSISGKDSEVIYELLKGIENPKEFTIQLLYNQIINPEIPISKFKKIPENELIELGRHFIKYEYNLSEYFTETTDKEFFINFRDAVENYLKNIYDSLSKSLKNIRAFSYRYPDVINQSNLISLAPKINIEHLLASRGLPTNLISIISKPAITTNSLISVASRLSSTSRIISNVLIPQIDTWKFWVSQKSLIFNNQVKLWEEFEEKYQIAQKDAISCLNKYKWFMTPSLPIDFVYTAIEICKKGGNQRKSMNELFINYFSEDNFAELENLVESWKDNEIFKSRMKILRDCVTILKETSSKANAANLVIPTLISQIDGIQSEFMKSHGLKVTRRGLIDSDGNILKDDDGNALNKKDWYRELTLNDELLDSANDIFLNILFQGSKTGEPLKTPFTFSRHKIMHGEYIKYGRMDNTIRAFLILDFLASLIEENGEDRS